MGRLIDVIELKKSLAYEAILKEGKTLDQIIDEQPTIKSEPHWIPVTERLPKSNGVYVVTRTTEDGFTSADIVDACYFDGSNTWHDDTRVNHGRKYLNCITAWMPLPEPYKGEQ